MSNLRRLAWHTRRGIKEVEMILIPFFEQHYNQLPAPQKALFEQLLEYPDTDLFNWLLNHETPPDQNIKLMIDEILKRTQHPGYA